MKFPKKFEIPAAVRRYAGKRALEIVWVNEVGGLTFRIRGGLTDTFIKWNPADSGIDLQMEEEKLRWAIAFTPVPKVLEFGKDNTGQWLVTVGMGAESAVSDRWREEPALAVIAIGRGLRSIHGVLPLEECPFTWSIQDRIARARVRIAKGETDPTQWHEEFRGLSVEAALAELSSPPPADDLVLCHGDACAPNTLIDADGKWVGHVDMGSLGIADRWADLAIASWSTQWNYGLGWENLLYDSYGISPDAKKIRFYRLLYDLAD